jgi:hypothetical protein
VRATPRFNEMGEIMHWHGLSEEITGQMETASNLRQIAGLIQGNPDINPQ